MSNGIAIFGAVTGGLGLTLSVLNFLRDGARVEISLNWGMVEYGPGAVEGYRGLITLTNAGRRTVFLSHIHLVGDPSGTQWLISGGVAGVTLGEGSKPHALPVNQDAELETKMGANWWLCRAAAIDASGQVHYSRWPTTRPSFASADPPPLALPMARFLNWWRRTRPW